MIDIDTDSNGSPGHPPDPDSRLSPVDVGPMPDCITVPQAFIARLPSQRIIDMLRRLEPDANFGELIEAQPPRLIAFRWLLREHPTRDATSLWMAAYDIEVAIADVDPTSGSGPTPSLPSAPSTT
jgi:hypothetical protein